MMADRGNLTEVKLDSLLLWSAMQKHRILCIQMCFYAVLKKKKEKKNSNKGNA